MTQSISLMRSSRNWNFKIEKGVKKWLTKYYDWLETSRLGIEEKNANNNHGTFYDVQAIYILQYLDRIDKARNYSIQAIINRIETGILPTGEQPHETKRPSSWF